MIPALIAAGASLAGGLLQNSANKEANKAAEANAQKQYEQQKEFAQSGIQWKVKDAEAAGVHPLYALGANTVSYAPQSVGSTPSDFSFVKDTGQNIGRAIDATRSAPASALALRASQIQIEGLQLDNELKKAQLASAMALTNQAGQHPNMPSMMDGNVMAGQGNSTPLMEVSKKIAPTMRNAKNIEVGGNPEVVLYKTKSGYAPQIPQGLSESFEQDNIGYWQWAARNRLFGDQNAIRSIPTRPGFRKHYSPWAGEYYYAKYPTYRKGTRELKGYPR